MARRTITISFEYEDNPENPTGIISEKLPKTNGGGAVRKIGRIIKNDSRNDGALILMENIENGTITGDEAAYALIMGAMACYREVVDAGD